jgi:hypothetical protein
MPISNTSLLIKRSSATAKPATLLAGELAYSYLSNTVYIGTAGGNGTLNIGGQFYTSTIDAATNANTAGAIVRRDATGAFYGALYGTSNNAIQLQNSRNFSLAGGDVLASAVGFNGTGDVILNASLATISGLTPGSYGSGSLVPVINVAANGRILSISTTAVVGGGGGGVSNITVNNGAGSTNTINVGAGVNMYFYGTGGITTTAAANGITFGHDSTVLRSNTTSVGPQVINTNLTITGNLYVQGNTTQFNTNSLNIADPLISLGSNNAADLLDLGFVANYFDGANTRHAGLFRNSADKVFYIFDNYLPEPLDTNDIDTSNTSFRVATLKTNIANSYIANSTVVNLLSALNVADGGTGRTSLTASQILVGAGTGAVVSLANVGTANQYGNAAYIPVLTTDGYGRVSAVTNTAIAIDTSQISTGTLAYARGGTGSSSYTTGNLIIAGTTGFVSLANTNVAIVGTPGAASTLSAFTIDPYGRVTGATFSSISGLTVSQGGTGGSTFTANGIIYGNATGALLATAAPGLGADQAWSNQILTVTNAGVPVWASTMDGGTF